MNITYAQRYEDEMARLEKRRAIGRRVQEIFIKMMAGVAITFKDVDLVNSRMRENGMSEDTIMQWWIDSDGTICSL